MVLVCILLCKSIRYDLTGYISLVIKLNILNHMMILASADYSYKNDIFIETFYLALFSNYCSIFFKFKFSY